MAVKPNVYFRKVRGRIIPIRQAGAAGVGRTLRAAAGIHGGLAVSGSIKLAVSNPKVRVKANPFLKAAALGTSVVSGIVSGATLFSGGKRFWAGQATSLGLDVLSPTLNVAAHAGKGKFRERARGIAKTEALSQAVGYGSFAIAALASPKGRKYTMDFAKRGTDIVRRLILRGKVL